MKTATLPLDLGADLAKGEIVAQMSRTYRPHFILLSERNSNLRLATPDAVSLDFGNRKVTSRSR